MFEGRTLLIATKHRKEQVIAPILEEALGVKCVLSENIDTDVLGTFTGEVERTNSPLETARMKCELAREKDKFDLILASEGSFGLHPYLFFVIANEEMLLLKDYQNQIEITVNEIFTETNFDGASIRSEQELIDFAQKVQFPSHGLILRPSKDNFTLMTKGIIDWQTLKNVFHSIYNKYGFVYVETDMRAMYNPTRMKMIGETTQKLVEKAKSLCPICQTPGFGITGFHSGLPCRICSMPTRSIKTVILSCQKCLYHTEQIYRENEPTEDPMYCDFCNP
ncbi:MULTISPECIES: DUF6671 family protein [unclassified Arcicella]|uniref:DUF6671 family protein n=1 Tax=unclassified Arcicella TaxID=2644986 RepID=UPI00285CA70C|nr:MULTISPECIES: DUF6671 family protein [unclassified Arcicella]MDR6562183.1 hypothetical protein [Arcicella sp. BE51]MDR6812122.1 hypothetical protein [Arcicella sp. BE140]MDR6823434.1 hypothetical protein [Arcicella sp. BE139]